MDIIAPRKAPTSLSCDFESSIPSIIFFHLSCSFKLVHVHILSLSCPQFFCMLRCLTSHSLPGYKPYPSYFSLFINNNNIFQLPMENHSKDTMEGMKDQQKEATADYDSSKPASHYILPHLLNLYASRATRQDFEIYAPNATFEDPLMRAQGVKQIKSSFYSLNKFFSESKIVEYNITEKEISPGKHEILIDNKQYYKCLGKDIHMISLIKLYTEGGKVVRHEDCWDKKPLRNRETVKVPLVGRMIEASRRASMLLTHALMGFGKDPTM